MGTFEIFRSSANQEFYFRFKSGDQLLNSEGYGIKSSCQNGIESVKKNAPLDSRYERKNNDGRYSFNLKAANGEIIARSTKVFGTAKERDEIIEIIKKEAPGASVIDLT